MTVTPSSSFPFSAGDVQAACSSLVHCGQRVALMGMAETQKGQFLVVGSSLSAGSPLQGLDMLGDGRLRGDAEVARDLRVGGLVTVALDEARDVFEDLPLALRPGLHR